MALVAAFANAVSSICQRLGVEDAPPGNGPSLGLVRHMIQRPIWILGFAIMALGYAAQSVALHLGALNEVQPLMVSELVILVFILWLWFSTPLRARDLAAALATALGLAVGLTVSVVVGALVLLGTRGPAWWRALLLGAGASVGFALLAAITKSMTNLLVAGWSPLLTSWQLYALCAIGLGSFIVMQSAFQVGPFAASQSTLILMNPLVSIAIGHVLYGENLVIGALGLSTSSLVAKVHEDATATHLLKGRGRYARRRQREP